MPTQKRRNRKRSKRRAIFCPIHGCYLDSVSQKHRLYADKAEQLCDRGMSRRTSERVMAHYTTVGIDREWLEAFWCEECQQNEWYWIRRSAEGHYEVGPVPDDMWECAQGVILAGGNPTVSQFTQRHSRQTTYRGLKDFAEFR